MTDENLKEKYFIISRIILVLLFSIYGVFKQTGVSELILLLVLLFITTMTLKMVFDESKAKLILMIIAIPILIFLIKAGGMGFLLCGLYLTCEIFSFIKVKPVLYLLTYTFLFVPDFPDKITLCVIITMLLILYTQHQYIVLPYKQEKMADIVTQQDLKRDIQLKDYETRAALSQTLHDKLGHNINGSIYQLEASKVIMDSAPDKAKGMIQAVIDQLRTGMDEIRAILRKERPTKKKAAILQLHQLCADCHDKGVEAQLITEGDTSVIPDNIWEVILDNVFEAVTNPLKYSKCRKIDINIVVFNKIIKCTISDDGIGCNKIEDGMGLSGMRKRTRGVNGTIEFESEVGFRINMLLPINR